jgi:hypothetical protein
MKNELKLMREKIAFTRVRLFYCIAGFGTLFGGIAVYAFFRTHDMVLFRFVPKPAFLDALFIPVKNGATAGSALLFNLPDGLWVLSGVLFIRALWLTSAQWRAIYFGIFAATALALEIGQLSATTPGTFDWLDLLFMGIGAFVESLIFNLFIKRRVV